jgi:hypothetical protein
LSYPGRGSRIRYFRYRRNVFRQKGWLIEGFYPSAIERRYSVLSIGTLPEAGESER